MTGFYSVLHILVDGVCAMAMFGTFLPMAHGYFYILLYNFCAFAMQMPFGVLLDILNGNNEKKKTDFALLTAAAGVMLTIAGAVIHPVILGIGNALFHVGGGVGTIRDGGNGGHNGGVQPGATGDGGSILHGGNVGNESGSRSDGSQEKRLAARLGVFVAPGALGLYAGTLLAQNGIWKPCFWAGSVLMLVLCGGAACIRIRQCMRHVCEPYTEAASKMGNSETEKAGGGRRRASLRLAVCCLLVVILRSYIGMAVSFSWKSGVLAGILSVLAVAGGKAAGGMLSVWKGSVKTAAVSLFLAAVCYFCSGVMPVGLAALFLFHMTMPITLYWMVRAFPKMPGFAFGCLTFALFLGFVPVYLGMPAFLPGNVLGCAGSLISLLLLAAATGKGGRRTR
ncbi:MAG: hypothetical protein NC409_07665 [Clostridium sp.]|nr:hypothetical protein [Clostridium sp.]